MAVGVDRDRWRAHDLADSDAPLPMADERLNGGDIQIEDVGLADHADEAPGLVDDREPGDAVASHQILGLLDRRVDARP